MSIHEHDCVRLKESVTGPNTFGGGNVITKPAGAEGCAISVYWDACEVEFDDDTFLVVPFDKLTKYWDAASRQHVA